MLFLDTPAIPSGPVSECDSCEAQNLYGPVIHNDCCFYFAETSRFAAGDSVGDRDLNNKYGSMDATAQPRESAHMFQESFCTPLCNNRDLESKVKVPWTQHKLHCIICTCCFVFSFSQQKNYRLHFQVWGVLPSEDGVGSRQLRPQEPEPELLWSDPEERAENASVVLWVETQGTWEQNFRGVSATIENRTAQGKDQVDKSNTLDFSCAWPFNSRKVTTFSLWLLFS